MTRKLKGIVIFVCTALFFLFIYSASMNASLKYKRETGKKCTFCHTGIPNPGDEDPQLSADGKKFRDNNYQLTEEQKKRPGK